MAPFIYHDMARIAEEQMRRPAASPNTLHFGTMLLAGNQRDRLERLDPDYLGPNHDRFGRPGQVTRPDGKTTTLTYTGTRLIMRRANVNVPPPESPEVLEWVYTTERRDAFGRLVAVCEGADVEWSGNGCAADGGVETTYRFDVSGKLDRVCSVPNGATCGQQRLFDIDRRGFLMGERHPEVGASGNGWTRYTFDTRGNPLTKDVPGTLFDLASRFDAAGRLIWVEETHSGRPLKEFYFGVENIGANLMRGKMVMAKRHNHVAIVGPLAEGQEFDAVVTEYFTFEGRDGRVSEHQTRYSLGTAHYAFDTAWTWNELGNVDTIEYPQCDMVIGDCPSASPPRTVSHTYDKGFLRSVPGFASLIAYQGGGMLHQINHTNGVTLTIERDASGMDRPRSISTNAGWATGTHTYDGHSNITAIGSQDYLYDKRSQLLSGEVNLSAEVVRSQQASYDDFGNITSLTTHGSTLSTTTDPSTNRMTGLSADYDVAGNMTDLRLDNVDYEYTFDALNMMKYLQSSANEAQVYLYTANDERFVTFDCVGGVCAGEPSVEHWTIRDLGGRVLREIDHPWGEGWEWKRDYVYRGSQLLAAVESNGSGGERVRHLHLDHLGTPRQITGPSGGVVAFHAYYPFGEEATDPLQDAVKLKFTGHERDGGGLDYMHARYCGPRVGRFFSTDPKGRLKPVRLTVLWNRFSYSANNPIKYTDPNGEDIKLVFDFSRSQLDSKQRTLIAVGIRQRFRNAGVRNVEIFFPGGSRSLREEKSTDRIARLNFQSESFAKKSTALGKTPIPGSSSSVTTAHSPRGNAAMINQLVNTGTHEAGH